MNTFPWKKFRKVVLEDNSIRYRNDADKYDLIGFDFGTETGMKPADLGPKLPDLEAALEAGTVDFIPFNQ